MKKIMVEEIVGEVLIEEYSVNELLEKLSSFKERFGENVKLVPEGGYSGFYEFKVVMIREQTTEEHTEWLKKNEKAHKASVNKRIKSLVDKKLKGKALTEEEANFLKENFNIN